MKNKKVKKRVSIFLAIYIMVGVALISFLGYRVYADFFKKESIKEEEKYKEIGEYGYTLKKNDTEIYKKYFNELNDLLNKEKIDYENYAEILAKLFIIDFYTLENKIASTDIGALEFIYPSQIDNFKLNAGDTIYKYIERNSGGERTQELPQVSEVTVLSIKESTYKIDKTDFNSYEVKVSIEYVKDLGYDIERTLTIIKDNDRLYVVEGK